VQKVVKVKSEGSQSFHCPAGNGPDPPTKKMLHIFLSWFKGFIAKLQDIMGTLLWNNKKQAYSVCGRNANG